MQAYIAAAGVLLGSVACAALATDENRTFVESFDGAMLQPTWQFDAPFGWHAYIEDGHAWLVKNLSHPAGFAGLKVDLCGKRFVGDGEVMFTMHRDTLDSVIGMRLVSPESPGTYAYVTFIWGGVIFNPAISAGIAGAGGPITSTYQQTSIQNAAIKIVRIGTTITVHYDIGSGFQQLLSHTHANLALPFAVQLRHANSSNLNAPPTQSGWIDDVVINGAVELGSDLTGDGIVGAEDLAVMLNDFGACEPDACCESDHDGDGAVTGRDLAALLGDWTI